MVEKIAGFAGDGRFVAAHVLGKGKIGAIAVADALQTSLETVVQLNPSSRIDYVSVFDSAEGYELAWIQRDLATGGRFVYFLREGEEPQVLIGPKDVAPGTREPFVDLQGMVQGLSRVYFIGSTSSLRGIFSKDLRSKKIKALIDLSTPVPKDDHMGKIDDLLHSERATVFTTTTRQGARAAYALDEAGRLQRLLVAGDTIDLGFFSTP